MPWPKVPASTVSPNVDAPRARARTHAHTHARTHARTHTPSASPVMWGMRRYYRHVNGPLSLSPQVYVGFPGPMILCPERVYDDRGRECVCLHRWVYRRSSRSSHPVYPCINIRVYLWIYTGAEHWINRAVVLVVVVVVYDGKLPLRGRWVNIPGLIHRFEVYRMSTLR
jgi:hypothetical protein